MSVDVLQEKIRKLKNPSVVDMTLLPEELPPFMVVEDASVSEAYGVFCRFVSYVKVAISPRFRNTAYGVDIVVVNDNVH